MASPRGKIWLHRKTLESEVFEKEWLWKLFTWCMLKANYKPGKFKGETIQRGSFVTGKTKAAEELNAHPSRVYRGLSELARIGCIKLRPNRDYTIVTVCNYGIYQDRSETIEPQLGLPFAEERTASEPPAKPIEQEQEFNNEPSNHPPTPFQAAGREDGRQETFPRANGHPAPPPVPAPADPNDALLEPDRIGWGGVCDRLAALGATRWREATREARDAGCTAGHAHEIIDYAARNNFQVGAIICRLSCARPTMPLESGWVNTAPPVPVKTIEDRRAAEAARERNNSEATHLIKQCRRRGIVTDDAIKKVLKQCGLTWPDA